MTRFPIDELPANAQAYLDFISESLGIPVVMVGVGPARDFGPRGITINIVQPGPIDTDANPEDGPMKDLLHSFMAIKRHGRPEEVAGMVAWLAGPETGFVTGAMHTIDGAFGA